jgi:hypothetical protein
MTARSAVASTVVRRADSGITGISDIQPAFAEADGRMLG